VPHSMQQLQRQHQQHLRSQLEFERVSDTGMHISKHNSRLEGARYPNGMQPYSNGMEPYSNSMEPYSNGMEPLCLARCDVFIQVWIVCSR